jgi:hypothetical protein
MCDGFKIMKHEVWIMCNNISVKYRDPKYLELVTIQSQIWIGIRFKLGRKNDKINHENFLPLSMIGQKPPWLFK